MEWQDATASKKEHSRQMHRGKTHLVLHSEYFTTILMEQPTEQTTYTNGESDSLPFSFFLLDLQHIELVDYL